MIIVGVVALLAIVVYFVFSQNQSSDSTATEAEKSAIAQERSLIQELPTATTTSAKTAGAKAVATKSVEIGELDWTKNQATATGTPIDVLESIQYSSSDEEERVKSGDYCALAGLSDSWSEPFEKTVCSMTRFAGDQIIEPLNQIACNFAGAALAANYGDNIKSKYVDGQCYIIDRK